MTQDENVGGRHRKVVRNGDESNGVVRWKLKNGLLCFRKGSEIIR